MTSEEILGASEFAATLNGDNPQAMLRVLKKFCKTVRRERRLALSTTDDEDESDSDEDSSDEEDTDVQVPPNKKFKKSEEWKKDTESYHVPFVGTAVATGDAAAVVKGEWPTGLLQAYLTKSPLAMELLNDDLIAPEGKIHTALIRKKKGSLSRALFKWYLLALSELVTALIPAKKNITEDSEKEKSGPPFFPVFIKKFGAAIFKVLNDETDKGKGKPGVFGGCGSWAVPALKLLQTMSTISTAQARLVARYLEEELASGVLRILLRPAPPRNRTNNDNNDENDGDNGNDDNEVPSKTCRIEAIRLATILLKSGDSAVNNYICTGGNRERKVNPGILYIALGEGMMDHALSKKNISKLQKQDLDEDHMDAVAGMLKTIRMRLLDPYSTSSQRLYGELLSKEALHQLCQYLSLAPPLAAGATYDSILAGTDEYEDLDNAQTAGIEARRLVFLLLSDTSRSPLLQRFNEDIQMQRLVNPDVVKILAGLLEAPAGGTVTRKFLLHCVENTPSFLVSWFKIYSFPDPRNVFGFITSMGFIAALQRQGPKPISCIPWANQAMENDDILLSVLPAKFQRSQIGRALQSPNELVVFESLKIVKSSLERFDALRSDLRHTNNWDEERLDALTSSFSKWIPDLQLILALRSKFDACSRSKKSHILINDLIFRLLEAFADILPSTLNDTKFDWMKLLPTATNFSRASPLIQRRTMKTLLLTTGACGGVLTQNANKFKTVLEILLTTKIDTVYEMCRSLAQNLLSATLQGTVDGNKLIFIKHEVSCWLAALSTDYVEGFCKIVQEVSNNLLKLLSNLEAKTVEYLFAGKAEFSVFLVSAMNSVDKSIAPYVSQVVARCLLRQRNPIPLATLIVSFSESGSFSGCRQGSALVEYAKCLLNFEADNVSDRLQKLAHMLDVCFTRQLSWSLACKLTSDDMSSGTLEEIQIPTNFEDALSFARFLIHVQLCSSSSNLLPLTLLARIVPVLILYDTESEETSSVLQDTFRLQEVDNSHEFHILDTIIKSYPSWKKQCAIEYNREASATSAYESGEGDNNLLATGRNRASLLGLSLAEESLPIESVAKIKIGLLHVAEEDKKLANIALRWMLHFGNIFKRTTGGNSSFCYEPQVVNDLVGCWWKLLEPSTDVAVPGSLRVHATSHVSCFLTQILKNDDLNSVIVESSIGAYDATQCIHHCMRLASLEHEGSKYDGGGNLILLQTLLERFPLRFIPLFLATLEKPEKRLFESWESGLFDECFLIAIRKHTIDKERQQLYMNITRKILSRTFTIFSQDYNSEENISTVRRLTQVTEVTMQCLPFSDHESDVCRVVALVLDKCLSAKQFRSDPSLKVIVGMGMKLVEASDCEQANTLSTRLFVLLCELLPKSYKQKGKDTSIFLQPDAIIDWLRLLTETVKDFDPELMKGTDQYLLQKVCRSCLKFGIAPSTTPGTSIPAQTIRLVRVIIESCFDASSAFGQLKTHYVIPAPADVFQMLTSHSKISVVLSDDDKDDTLGHDCNTKTEIFRLMHTCLKLDSSNIVVAEPLWQDIFSAFSAGLGECDTAIRLCLQACCISEVEGIEVPFLDQFRWKGCLEKSSNATDRWDWLLTALDPSRIRATVSHFPLFDTVRLDPDNYKNVGTNEAEADTNHRHQNSSAVDASQDSDDSDDSEDSDEDEQSQGSSVSEDRATFPKKKQHLLPSNHGLSPSVPWKKSARDNRYSPGFLLPIILGAIESCLLDDHCKDNSPPDVAYNDGTDKMSMQEKFSKNLIPTVHGLCEKGVVSFCLASLSSRSREVRQYSVAILGTFILAINTEEARKRSSWRQRPQLAMVLNAVQRAYVLKRVGLDDSGTAIPVLTPLVSTFLARASISVSKPDAALFPALNHYFLKSDKEHGAFQDMNRLPGFMSLFCSSAEDSSIARKERMWALQTLRDGFLDPSCYRLVSTCHAPELMLTSFENVRLGKTTADMKGQEFTLLLEVIGKLIDFGGITAVRHLVKLVGLLSWMRSICIARNLFETFPTLAAKRAFCDLVASVTKAASADERLRTDVLLHDISMLSQSVLDICSTSASGSKVETEPSLVESSCLALNELGSVFSRVHDGLGATDAMHYSGFAITSGLRFLKAVPTDMQGRVAIALSIIPVNLQDFPPADGEEFCSLLLRRTELDSTETNTIAVFKRISLVGQSFQSKVGADSETLRLLLLSRAKAKMSTEAHLMWLKCISVFSSASDISRQIIVARQFLKNVDDAMDIE